MAYGQSGRRNCRPIKRHGDEVAVLPTTMEIPHPFGNDAGLRKSGGGAIEPEAPAHRRSDVTVSTSFEPRGIGCVPDAMKIAYRSFSKKPSAHFGVTTAK
jgi:hypothetical protein